MKWVNAIKHLSYKRKVVFVFFVFIAFLLLARCGVLVKRIIFWNQQQVSLFALRDLSDTHRLEAEIDRLNGEYNSLAHLFFNYEQLRYFSLQELPDLITDSGLVLEKIIFEQDEVLLAGSQDKGAFTMHPIGLYLKGNYSDVMAFIQTVENYSLMTRVTEISLAPESDFATTLSVRLRLSCYGVTL